MKRIVIVNRGESALRCIRAIRDYEAEHALGLRSIALFTAVDRDAPFVRAADEAVELAATPGAAAAAYLDIEGVMRAIEATRGDSVWVGWGFLAENAEFAARVEGEGLCFVGPSADAMRRLGDKIAGKSVAEQCDVPVVPWSQAGVAELAEVEAVVARIGLPVLLKAAAGGGGRGIRIVREHAELAAAFGSATAEAVRAFGDGRVFIERCIDRARHLEVQLAADVFGTVKCFGVRDCSVQRRHQKVIEEAPGPITQPRLVRRLEAYATRLAQRAKYRGVGTVEFILDLDRGDVFFMEMNTRLQVEHPITELVYGVDLVKLQLDIARGLPIESVPTEPRGYAIEARLNAEDPARGFTPSTGTIKTFTVAGGPGIRVDSGVAAGDLVAPDFDSMLAKIIAFGRDRGEAIARLRRALADTTVLIAGGTTNKGLLAGILSHEAFVQGSVDTRWLDRTTLPSPPLAAEALHIAAVLAHREDESRAVAELMAEAKRGIPRRLPDAMGGTHSLRGHDEISVYCTGPDCYRIDDTSIAFQSGHVSYAGRAFRLAYDISAHDVVVELDGHSHRFARAVDNVIRTPAPALVAAVHVQVGDTVEVGQIICTLEAMKTEMPMRATQAGRVAHLYAAPGMQVSTGMALVELSDAVAGEQRTSVLTEPTLSDGDLARELTRLLSGYDCDAARLPLVLAFLKRGHCDPGLAPELEQALAAYVTAVETVAGDEPAFYAGLLDAPSRVRMLVAVRRTDAAGKAREQLLLGLVRLLERIGRPAPLLGKTLTSLIRLAPPRVTVAARSARHALFAPPVAFSRAPSAHMLARFGDDPKRVLYGTVDAVDAIIPAIQALLQEARSLSADETWVVLSSPPTAWEPLVDGLADAGIERVKIVLDFGPAQLLVSHRGGHRIEVEPFSQNTPVACADALRLLTSNALTRAQDALPPGRFVEYDLGSEGAVPVQRQLGLHSAGIVFGLVSNVTAKHPEGMQRVLVLSDASKDMGALGEPECRRLIAAIDLADALHLPLEWLPISSGARIAMDSGTENLDWTARVLRRIVGFCERGGEINIIVDGVNVGAQSYFNAEATMLMHTRGILIMTPRGSMVLTGKRALDYSGGVSAEDERGIGGYQRVMGPNGQAQYFAPDLVRALQLLFRHYETNYVAPGENTVRSAPCPAGARPAAILEQVFGPGNAERKHPFDMRALMAAVSDDAPLERFADMADAQTAIVWDCHLGGCAVKLIGFESQPLPRAGVVPADGPDTFSGGTLFPLSSKKVARAMNAASGVKPVVVLANLSGFDGSPESMRKLQLEYGAEIGRAVVKFAGPIIFCVVARYHGGAYVVFSRALNDELRSLAVAGSFASVIGGAPAAAVVFAREVRAQVARYAEAPDYAARLAAAQMTLAREFDAIHSVERACRVGSLDAIIDGNLLREELIACLPLNATSSSHQARAEASAAPQ